MKLIKFGAAWLVCAAALAMAGCAGIGPIPTPDPAAYTAAFKACLTNQGLSEASPEVVKIWNILDTGGNSAQEILKKIEDAAVVLTADTAIICVDCAVIAWEQGNPIVKGKPITKSQAAVRLFKARHLSRPTLRRPSAAL